MIKVKAFLYNFSAFLIIFLILRYLLLALMGTYSIWIVFGAAIISSLIAPKFAVTRENEQEVIKMKWIFMRGFKTFK